MRDLAYLRQKLESLSESGAAETGRTVVALTTKFAKGGALHGGSYHYHVRDALKTGYRETVERMATWLIQSEMHTHEIAGQEFTVSASKLEELLTEQHRVALFGNPAFGTSASDSVREQLRGELVSIRELVDQDMRRSIVGTRRIATPTSSDGLMGAVNRIADLIAGQRGAPRWRLVTGFTGWAAALAVVGWLIASFFGFSQTAGALIGIGLFLLPIADRLLRKGGLPK